METGDWHFLSSHRFGLLLRVSHVPWSVCFSLRANRTGEPGKTTEPYGAEEQTTRAQEKLYWIGKHIGAIDNWIRVWRRCSLVSNYFDHLLDIFIRTIYTVSQKTRHYTPVLNFGKC